MVFTALWATFFMTGPLAPDATMTFGATSLEPDVLSLMRFQNINSHTVGFEGESLEGKAYQVRVKRFDQGKLVLDQVLLDTAELGSLGKVKGGKLTFKLVSQAKDGKLKIQLQAARFSSDKVLEAPASKYEYVMKDFLGGTGTMKFTPEKETYFLACLLPTEHGDGSASYCEVAQSGKSPEKLGSEFKIPTYFLVSILFKK